MKKPKRRSVRKPSVAPEETLDDLMFEVDHPWEVTPFMLQEKERLIALEERSHNYGYNHQTGKVERMRPQFDY